LYAVCCLNALTSAMWYVICITLSQLHLTNELGSEI